MTGTENRAEGQCISAPLRSTRPIWGAAGGPPQLAPGLFPEDTSRIDRRLRDRQKLGGLGFALRPYHHADAPQQASSTKVDAVLQVID